MEIVRAKWGIRIDFSSVGYKRYYRRNRFTMISKFNLRKRIAIKPSMEICGEGFQNSGHYTELKGGFGIAYTARKCHLESGLADIELKNPYKDFESKERFKPFLSCLWVFSDGLTLKVGIRRFDNHRTRWVFDQYIALNENLGLNVGYKNRPSSIYGGIDLTIKGFSVIISYCSIGELADSIIWGISFGK